MVSDPSIGSGSRIARPASLDAILDFAWRNEEFTATDAIESIGLTRSTTIGAMDTLLGLGLLRELPNLRSTREYRRGRPARRFELRDDAAVLLALDAGHEHLTVVVTDLRGRARATHRESFDPQEDDPAARRRQIASAVDTALLAAGQARADVLALCAGVPAPVNAAGRSPRHKDGFWTFMNPALIDEFSVWVPVVRVENDAYLAAIAEGATGAAIGCADYIVLLAEAGMGAGVVVDGRAVRGAHGGAGEMAALDLVGGVDGSHGLDVTALVYAREALARGDGGELADVPEHELTGRAIVKLAAAGGHAARQVIERMGESLGRIVGLLGSLFDPARVILAGPAAEDFEAVVQAARAAIPAGIDLPAPELLVSTLGADVVATGAIAAAVDAARANALDVWLARQPSA